MESCIDNDNSFPVANRAGGIFLQWWYIVFMQEPNPRLWRVFIPLLPWVLITFFVSLFFRRWGLAWVPWAALTFLATGTVVLANLRRPR